jgi:DMSO/TMAO reductase YedYZ molybdopterin-dependent catalytic subunit
MDVASPGITYEELQLAARNHGLPLEALRDPVTPAGLHYLLIHFDIPAVDAAAWRLYVGGEVKLPLELTLDELHSKPSRTLAVILECAGNGRALMSPRAASQPWVHEAIGNAEWTGTPLAPILQEAGLSPCVRSSSPASIAASRAASSTRTSGASLWTRRSATTCCWCTR